jgi:ferredoxin--NADP+ reductase
MVNRDLTLGGLRSAYHAVILATGSDLPRRLGIPGEDLADVHPARSFAGWCCGHPDYADACFDLDAESVVIIGHGNVALDAARLLCRTVDELRFQDIPDSVLDVLATSRVRDVYLVGRGGPADAKFTYPELREMSSLADCVPVVDASDLPADDGIQPATSRSRSWNLKTFREYASRGEDTRRTGRQCHFLFNMTPTRFRGTDRLTGVDFAKALGQFASLDAELALVAIGNLVSPWSDLPYDNAAGTHRSDGGMLISEEDNLAPVFAAGWFHRTPSGLIGHNKADSEAVVARILNCIEGLELRLGSRDGAEKAVKMQEMQYISASDWGRLNEQELARGEKKGKPREKFTAIDQFFALFSN